MLCSSIRVVDAVFHMHGCIVANPLLVLRMCLLKLMWLHCRDNTGGPSGFELVNHMLGDESLRDGALLSSAQNNIDPDASDLHWLATCVDLQHVAAGKVELDKAPVLRLFKGPKVRSLTCRPQLQDRTLASTLHVASMLAMQLLSRECMLLCYIVKCNTMALSCVCKTCANESACLSGLVVLTTIMQM